MSEKIGTTAGAIWKYLDKNGPTTTAKVTRELDIEDKHVQRAIGWLAQENKIKIEVVERAETLSLL